MGSVIESMGLGSKRYVQLFDLLGRTDMPKDGLPAYGKTASITSSRFRGSEDCTIATLGRFKVLRRTNSGY